MKSNKTNNLLAQQHLNGADPEIVIAAIKNLFGVGPDLAIDPLLSLLDHPDHRVRGQAALTLGKIGHAEPTRIIGGLLEATFDRDVQVKRIAIGSLSQLIQEETKADVIERFLDLTFDRDERIREKAAFELGNLELRENPIINRLVALLRDRDITVRGTAIDGLARIGNKTHLPLLKKFITPEPVYDIYDGDLVLKAKNASERVLNREA